VQARQAKRPPDRNSFAAPRLQRGQRNQTLAPPKWQSVQASLIGYSRSPQPGYE
jgi:hypothetical protein